MGTAIFKGNDGQNRPFIYIAFQHPWYLFTMVGVNKTVLIS